MDSTISPDFLADPEMSFEEFVLSTTYGFQSPIHRWNFMYRYWLLTLPPDRTVAVRHEDQVDTQILVLEQIEKVLKLERRSEALTEIYERMDTARSSRTEVDLEYYRNKEYLAEYGISLLEMVNSLLDRDVLEVFHYSCEHIPLARRRLQGKNIFVRYGTADGEIATHAYSDPHNLKGICDCDKRMSCAVELDGCPGAGALLLADIWPGCRTTIFDLSSDAARISRINARSAPFLTVRRPNRSADGTYPDSVEGLYGEIRNFIEHTITDGVMIDLLHACTEFAADSLLAIWSARIASGVRWACGCLPPVGQDAARFISTLAQTHEVEVFSSIGGAFFWAVSRKPQGAV